jgi:hypothetical protein
MPEHPENPLDYENYDPGELWDSLDGTRGEQEIDAGFIIDDAWAMNELGIPPPNEWESMTPYIHDGGAEWGIEIVDQEGNIYDYPAHSDHPDGIWDIHDYIAEWYDVEIYDTEYEEAAG